MTRSRGCPTAEIVLLNLLIRYCSEFGDVLSEVFLLDSAVGLSSKMSWGTELWVSNFTVCLAGTRLVLVAGPSSSCYVST